MSNLKRRCCENAALDMPANQENSAVDIGLEKVYFHSNPKERQCQRMFNFSSVSHVQLFVTPWTAACQVSLSITNSWTYSNSCPLSRWCHPAISSSVVLFSSCLQSLPASGSFPKSQLFTWGGQSIRVSASASILPMHGCNQFLHRFWSPRKWNITLFIFASYICSFKCSASVPRQKCVSGVMDKLPNF